MPTEPPTDTRSLIACPDCDLLHHTTPPQRGGVARCARCGAVLYRDRPRGVETALALTLSALLLFVLTNLLPLLALKMGGRIQETSLASGVFVFIDRREWLLAGLVFLTSLLFPLLRIAGLLAVLIPLRFNLHAPWLGKVFRLTNATSPWSMLEIFLLGGLVAAVKLQDMATVVPGIAAYSFAGLILTMSWAVYALEPRLIWERAGLAGAR